MQLKYFAISTYNVLARHAHSHRRSVEVCYGNRGGWGRDGGVVVLIITPTFGRRKATKFHIEFIFESRLQHMTQNERTRTPKCLKHKKNIIIQCGSCMGCYLDKGVVLLSCIF